MRLVILLAVLTGMLSGPVVAGEKPEWRSWPTGARFSGFVGYYRPKLNTQAVVSDENGYLGGLISFEDTLGLDSNKSTFLAYVDWRISKRNQLRFDYFQLDRAATQDSLVTLSAVNPDPPPDFLVREVELPLSAKFNIKSYNLTYAFSPLFTPRHDLAIGLGLALQKLEFGYQPTSDCNIPACDQFGDPRSVDSTAPLPTFNILYTYSFNENWQLRGNIGYLELGFELDDNESLDGSIVNGSVGAVWAPWKHVGFSIAYKFFDVDVDYEKRDLRAKADYDYKGFVFGVSAFY